VERILRLDTYKGDWSSLWLHNITEENGWGYGVIPLGMEKGEFEFLIFGGCYENE
jgi:hypothetical protein